MNYSILSSVRTKTKSIASMDLHNSRIFDSLKTARKFKSRHNLDNVYFAFRWFTSGYRFENSARAQKCIRKIGENFKVEKTEKSLEISVFSCLHLFQALNLARLLHLDVEWMARFAIVRGRSRKFIKACCFLKSHRFLPLSVLGNRSKTLLLPIICKRTDLPIASRLRSEGTSLKSHRLNSA